MFNRPLPALSGDLALLAGRVILGVVLFAHGWHKVLVDGLASTSGEFERLGIPLAILSASFTAFVEFVGGVLLIVGSLTTTVVALDLVVMVGAAVFVHLPHGIAGENGSLELIGVTIAAELLLVAKGPGRFSVDEWVLRLRRRDEQGPERPAAMAGVVPIGARVAAPDRLVSAGATPARAQGWVSGSWADGFDGDAPTSPEGGPVTDAHQHVRPAGSTPPQPDAPSETSGQWGVWRPADDGVVVGDRRGDAPGGGGQEGETATGGGPHRETAGPGDGGTPPATPARAGQAAGVVDGAGQGVGSRQAAAPAVPPTRAGAGVVRSLVAGGVGGAGGDRGLPVGAAESAPVSPVAGVGASFWTPAGTPAAPGRPAPVPVQGAAAPGRAEKVTPAPRTERAVPIPSPRPLGVVPTPAPRAADRADGAAPVPPAAAHGASPAARDGAAPDLAVRVTASVSARPAGAPTGLHRRPAEPARRSTTADRPVTAEIFRPVTEGVPPPAASYPHPGDTPDPVSKPVRAYAPQPSAPPAAPAQTVRPQTVRPQTVRPQTVDAGSAASGPPSTAQQKRTGTSPRRGAAGSGSATAVESVGVTAGAATPDVRGPLAGAATAAIPVTRPATMPGLHQSAEYRPTPTDALPTTSPTERSGVRRPAPRPAAPSP